MSNFDLKFEIDPNQLACHCEALKFKSCHGYKIRHKLKAVQLPTFFWLKENIVELEMDHNQNAHSQH